jgi:nicotinamidase-related amidase
MTTSSSGLTRDRPIVKRRAALLIIDVQNGTLGPEDETARPELHTAAKGRVIPNISRLLGALRAAELEVIYTVIENLTEDGRDRGLDYKLSMSNLCSHRSVMLALA